jgi:hypothetical protein
MDFDSATQKALGFTHPDHIERVWDDGKTGFKSLKHEGCFILHSFGISQLAGGGSKCRHGATAMLPDSKQEHHTSFGELWLEQVHSSQTLFFSPRGLPGFIYWYLLYPFRWLRFHILLHKIAKPS